MGARDGRSQWRNRLPEVCRPRVDSFCFIRRSRHSVRGKLSEEEMIPRISQSLRWGRRVAYYVGVLFFTLLCALLLFSAREAQAAEAAPAPLEDRKSVGWGR